MKKLNPLSFLAIILSIKIILYVIIWLPTINKDQPITSDKLDTTYTTSINTDTLTYYVVLNHIKDSEGLCLEPYDCPGGYSTIGYGHLILKNENFSKISKQQAEELLKKDFQKSIDKAMDYGLFNSIDTIYSLAHFGFCLGHGNLNKVVNKWMVNDIELHELLIKYVYYRQNGKLIESKGLLKRRQFEIELLKRRS